MAGQPVWIELNSTNEPVVHALRASHPEPNQLTGITGMTFYPNVRPEERFLHELETFDLHHGPYSTNTPYTELEVVRCPITVSIQNALIQLGFTRFDQRDNGFTAGRGTEQAAIRRHSSRDARF